jgi:hypothetical protein
LIGGVKRFLRNTAIYVTFHLGFVFLLPPLIVTGLHGHPVCTAAETAVSEVRTLYPSHRTRTDESIGLDAGSGNFLPTTLLSQSEYPIKDEGPIGGDQKPDQAQAAVEPITRALPIGGEKIRAMGFDLPLPFGVGANFVYMDQDIAIKNLKVDIGDTNIGVSGITFSNARSHDAAMTARLDFWLLPFANIYGIFGYINGEAELDVNLPALIVDLPIVGPTPITEPTSVNFNIDYNGTTFGGGTTLAGGYKQFFGSLDINYTLSNIDVVDGEIRTLTVSPRLGVLVNPSAIKGSLAFWVGAMYMDYKQTVTDDINLNELDPRLPSVEIDFELDIKNQEHWNFLFGGQWEITKRWQVMAEGGLGNRRHLILGAFFRF